MFTGGVLGFNPPLLSMKQCGTASKTCEKHGHSAMLQLSHSLLFVPFKELFFRQVGYWSALSMYYLQLGSYRELGTLSELP